MTGRTLMKNTPNWVLAVCGTVAFIAALAAFVAITVTGGDTSAFGMFLNTLLNAAGVILGGGAFVAAGAAAKSASKAEEQTNGILDKRIQNAINQALTRQSANANAAVQATYEKGVNDGRPNV